jgi:DNA repair protein RadC
LLHSHPSGDPSPWQADIQMTKAIIDIAKPLGISVHDTSSLAKAGMRACAGCG